MYERNAIVLERYFEKKLALDKPINLKMNYINYSDMIEELEKYQITVEEEEKIIQEFDEIAKKIQIIQRSQEKLSATNEKLEEERNRLFNALDESPSGIENRLVKIENTLEKNNEELKSLRSEFIEALNIFEQKQKERNKCAKERRIEETNHVTFLEKVKNAFGGLNPENMKEIKDFITMEEGIIEQEIYSILIKNGKSERVEFSTEAMQLASKVRTQIAEKEAECYLFIYDKLKKLLQEMENDTLKLAKYQKALRDTEVKLAFLRAEKEYIVGFLDNERMIAINGAKVHQKMMEEACHNFEADTIQIGNLYELILREIAGKSTKKAYKELYNKTYLKEIEEKEKDFEQEVNHIKIQMGTVINSNYWRIEGIKNIYNVFQEEVSEKFDKDLSEFRIEEPEEVEEKEEAIIGVRKERNFVDTKIFRDEYEEDDETDEFDEEEEEDEYEDADEYEEEEDLKPDNYDEEDEEDEYDDYDEEDYDEEDGEDYEEDDEDIYDEEEEDEDYDKEDNHLKTEEEYEEDDDFSQEENEEGFLKSKRKHKRENNKKRIERKEIELEEDDTKGIFNKFFKNKKK